MKFLGLAASFSWWQAVRHLFTVGSKKDYQELKAALTEKYGGRAVLYANGRTALARAIVEMAREKDLERIRLGARGRKVKTGEKSLKKPKVVVNGLTCYAVVAGVLGADCEPVYADIDEKTLHFDGEKLKKVLKENAGVVAVVVQNNLGIAADMEGILKVAKQNGIGVIEDLAHSVGLKYGNGMKMGEVGDAVVLSFGKGKACDVCGGGAVILRSAGGGIGLDLEPTKNAGWKRNLRDRIYPMIGWQVRMLFNLRMKTLAKGWLSACVKLGLIERSAEGKVDFDQRLSFWQAKILRQRLAAGKFDLKKQLRKFYLVEDRKVALQELERAGFYGPDFWYERPVSPERYYKKVKFDEAKNPNAVRISQQIINLPGDLDKIALKKFEKIIKKYEVRND